MVLRDYYDTKFGIFNHFDEEARQHPFASVEMHNSENFTECSALYTVIEEYANGSIEKVFGLNLIEYLQLPTYWTRMLKDVALRTLQRRAGAADAATQAAAKKMASDLGSKPFV